MWKLHRYYLKEVATNTFLAFIVLFGIALVCMLYRGIRLVEGDSMLSALLATFLLAADTLPHLVTISFLFATVLTYARASQEREITAIRSAGISPRVPMVAALLVGLLCSMFGSVATHYIIPVTHYEKYRVNKQLLNTAFRVLAKDRDRLSLGKGTMTWARLDEHGRYHDVTIVIDDERLAQQLQASLGEAGLLAKARHAVFDTTGEADKITLYLTDVRLPAQNWSIGNQRITLNVRKLAEAERRNERDKDLQSDQILSEVYRGVRSEKAAQHAEYLVHSRACFALMPFLLGPIGFCLGVLSRERGRVLALSFAMIPLALYYASGFLGESLLVQVDWSYRSLFGWLPAVLTVGLGFPFCWRLVRF